MKHARFIIQNDSTCNVFGAMPEQCWPFAHKKLMISFNKKNSQAPS